MNWISFETEDHLHQILQDSFQKPQIIFKHSTRCVISTMAKQRIEKYTDSSFDFHYLDLIQHRNLSNLIAEKFEVHHQSPQILIIKNGDCVFDESHGGINIQDLIEFKN